jgi:hypothetical protein
MKTKGWGLWILFILLIVAALLYRSGAVKAADEHDKFDLAPKIQWQKCLGGSNDDYADSIQETWDGGYIVAGKSESNDGDVTGHHGGDDY